MKAYNYQLEYNSEEMILIEKFNKNHSFKNDLESIDPLMETIKEIETFDPKQWIFYQLNLQIPLIKICNKASQVLYTLNSYKNSKRNKNMSSIDPRWNALKKLL